MIEAIACIGRSGQLGLDGKLPWGPEAAPGDLKWFKKLTMGSDFCVVGHNTMQGLPLLPGRALVVDTRDPIDEFLAKMGFEPRMTIMIIGGAKTYQRWMPHIGRWHIGRANYDGPADVWMPSLFKGELEINQ